MQCERARDLLSAFRDGELAAEESRVVAAHVATCKACAGVLGDHERIGVALRRHGRAPAPLVLGRRIGAALDRIDTEDAAAHRPVARLRARGAIGGHSRWLQHVAAALAVAVLTSLATWWIVSQAGDADRLAREVLAAHIRSLLQDAPVQIASSDQHTVKPWFAGRADFAPDIKSLANEGFPLAGGRLDYVAERRVAVAVYKRRLHVVAVFMWPATGGADTGTQLVTRNGYNLLSWSRGGVAYWAASDLNAAELRELQRLL